jgi:hypothetical protein
MIDLARTWRWIAIVMCAVIAGAVLSAPDPDTGSRSALAVHDFGHVVAFGLVTAFLALALPTRSSPTFHARFATACLAAGAALALGATIELIQASTGRNGDPWDVMRDGGGALSAALMMMTREPAISVRLRAALAAAALFVLAALTYPMLAALRDEARARAQYPTLVGFETTSELTRFRFADGMNARIISISDDTGWTASAMRLRLPPGKYPGFELRYFPRDWRGMRALRLLIVNPDPTPFEMTVRIDDAEYDYRLDLADRYTRAFPLAPGVNRIEILLSDVSAAPHGRRFDLGRVQSLLVYAVDLKQAREVVVGPITVLH